MDSDDIETNTVGKNPITNNDVIADSIISENFENSKKTQRRDFYNQCTMYVYPYGKNGARIKSLNIKLFNNGKVVLTGVKDDKEAHPAIEAVINGLNSIQPGKITYKALDNHMKEFKDDKDFERYLKINIKPLESLLRYAITKCTHFSELKTLQRETINMPIPTFSDNPNSPSSSNVANIDNTPFSNVTKLEELLKQLIADNNLKSKNKKKKRMYANTTNPISSGELQTPKDTLWNPIVNAQLMLLIKVYQLALIYVTESDISNICDLITNINIVNNINAVNNNNNIVNNNNTVNNNWLYSGFVLPILDHILSNYNISDRTITVVLPAFIRKDTTDNIKYNINATRIDMINSFFYANFQINRVNIQQILVNKYKMSADYKPDSYQGVNAKMISRATCKESIHQICVCDKRINCKCCNCREISVFIFRKGTIIITGAKAWDQIVDISQQIQKILIDEYPMVSLKPIAKKIHIDTLPDKVITDGCIWLKKSYIKNNPKNYFLIKEFKLSI